MTPIEVAATLRQFNEWRRDFDDKIEQPDSREVGEAIDAAVELIDRLEAAERNLSCCRAEREEAASLFLSAKTRLMKERDVLSARIEAMEKQEPYSYIYEYSNPIDGSPVWRDKPGYWNAQFPKSSKPLYLAPGAKGELEESK